LILNRILLAVLISASVWLLIRLWNRFTIKRRIREGLQLDSFLPGKPAILYFTSPDCLPCRTVQEPELNKISERYTDKLQIIKIDVLEHPQLADAWGVLSVPTTFIIDPDGRPRGVNHGVVREAKLLNQIDSLSVFPPNPAKAQSSVAKSQG
jgi:thioredoxin 1